MIPYWIMFGAVATGALQFASREMHGQAKVLLAMAALAITALVGLRYEVGGDWYPYLDIYDRIYFLDLSDALGESDVGYAFLNWLAAQLGAGIWFPNLACAAMVMFGLMRLSLRQPNPFLALLIAVPYLIIVVAMGYTRQAAAIGLICAGLASRPPNQYIKIFLAIAVATTMHRTAILALPILLVPLFRRNVVGAVGGIAMFGIAFVLVLRREADALVTNYVEGNYDSSGALVRVAMNVVAGGLFLAFRKRFGFDALHQNYWFVSSLLAFACLFLLAVLPSSSGVDRMALFLIPMQMVILSRLPYLEDTRRANREILLAVILYSAVVQSVWLFAGTHAEYWLPYRFYFAE